MLTPFSSLVLALVTDAAREAEEQAAAELAARDPLKDAYSAASTQKRLGLTLSTNSRISRSVTNVQLMEARNPKKKDGTNMSSR